MKNSIVALLLAGLFLVGCESNSNVECRIAIAITGAPDAEYLAEVNNLIDVYQSPELPDETRTPIIDLVALTADGPVTIPYFTGVSGKSGNKNRPHRLKVIIEEWKKDFQPPAELATLNFPERRREQREALALYLESGGELFSIEPTGAGKNPLLRPVRKVLDAKLAELEAEDRLVIAPKFSQVVSSGGTFSRTRHDDERFTDLSRMPSYEEPLASLIAESGGTWQLYLKRAEVRAKGGGELRVIMDLRVATRLAIEGDQTENFARALRRLDRLFYAIKVDGKELHFEGIRKAIYFEDPTLAEIVPYYEFTANDRPRYSHVYLYLNDRTYYSWNYEFSLKAIEMDGDILVLNVKVSDEDPMETVYLIPDQAVHLNFFDGDELKHLRLIYAPDPGKGYRKVYYSYRDGHDYNFTKVVR